MGAGVRGVDAPARSLSDVRVIPGAEAAGDPRPSSQLLPNSRVKKFFTL